VRYAIGLQAGRAVFFEIIPIAPIIPPTVCKERSGLFVHFAFIPGRAGLTLAEFLSKEPEYPSSGGGIACAGNNECDERTNNRERNYMLGWTLMFLVIALVAGVLGFTSIAGAAAGIAQILFVIFLVLFLASFVGQLLRSR
jgi:uncharacterized membrane protein YtjA (UPF0391 family)